jgi:CheY-like chemotaxis protein
MSSQHSKKLVLLIEKDVPSRKFTATFLKEAGYVVLRANNISEVETAIDVKPVDLVLIEWDFSGAKGTDIVRMIKERLSNQIFVPVLILASHPQFQTRLLAFQAGADDYLVEPFEPQELQARINAMLRIRMHSLKQLGRPGSDSEAVELSFDFPESVSTPCKQYLLYFVDFLRDIGIEATANFREEAGQVLFAVTPKDKDEALDNIREALEAYLDLPTRQVVIPIASPETSIEVQRLGSQGV